MCLTLASKIISLKQKCLNFGGTEDFQDSGGLLSDFVWLGEGCDIWSAGQVEAAGKVCGN